MGSMIRRMAGAARLNAATYEEVEADKSAIGQAIVIAIVSALAIPVGNWHPGDTGILTLALGTLLGWIIWLFLVWLVGVKLVPEPETRSDMGELIRTTGFAQTPGLFRVLGLLPVVGSLLVVAAWLWLLAASVIAVRQALDYRSLGRAIFVCVIATTTQYISLLLMIHFMNAASA